MDKNAEAMELFSRKEYKERQSRHQANGPHEVQIRAVWYKQVRPLIKAVLEKALPKINPDKFGTLTDYYGEETKMTLHTNVNSILSDLADYRNNYSENSRFMECYASIATIPQYSEGTDAEEGRIRNFFAPLIRELNKAVNMFTLDIDYDEDCDIYIVANYNAPSFQKLVHPNGAIDSFVAMDALIRYDSGTKKPSHYEKPSILKGAKPAIAGSGIIGAIIAGAKLNMGIGFGTSMFGSAIAMGLIAFGLWSADDAAAKKWMTKHPTDAEADSLKVLEQKYAPIINTEAVKLSQIIRNAEPTLKSAGFKVKPGPGMKKSRNPYSMAGNCVALVKMDGIGKSMGYSNMSVLRDQLKDQIADLDEELIEKYDGKIRVLSVYNDKYCAYFVVLDWFNSDGVILPNLT